MSLFRRNHGPTLEEIKMAENPCPEMGIDVWKVCAILSIDGKPTDIRAKARMDCMTMRIGPDGYRKFMWTEMIELFSKPDFLPDKDSFMVEFCVGQEVRSFEGYMGNDGLTIYNLYPRIT